MWVGLDPLTFVESDIGFFTQQRVARIVQGREPASEMFFQKGFEILNEWSK